MNYRKAGLEDVPRLVACRIRQLIDEAKPATVTAQADTAKHIPAEFQAKRFPLVFFELVFGYFIAAAYSQ